MPYIPPPYFNNGDLLSASSLNILADDIAYLRGLISAPNQPLETPVLDQDQPGRDTVTYWIRHKYRYLHLEYHIDHDPGEHITITYNGVTLIDENDPAEGVYTESIDLDAVIPALEYGEFYLIVVDFDEDLNSTCTINYMEERDTA